MSTRIEAAGLPLVLVKKEAFVSSLVMADLLGIEHESLIKSITTYQAQFEALNRGLIVRFEIGKLTAGRGAPTRYALLTEDQSYFAATLSKNTEQAVEVKFRLVKAFSELRHSKEASERDYLPYFHLLHDAGSAMFQAAQSKGSTTKECFFHINLEKMVNKAFSLKSGQRSELNAAMKSALGTAYQLGAQTIERELREGSDHTHAYEAARRVVNDFATLYLPKTGRIAA
jgi:phage regulator Rha-like protein